ncbi:protein kinase [Colletotrichum asianum]
MSPAIIDYAVDDGTGSASQSWLPEVQAIVEGSEGRPRNSSHDPAISAIYGQSDFANVLDRHESSQNQRSRLARFASATWETLFNVNAPFSEWAQIRLSLFPPQSPVTTSVCDDYGINQWHLNNETAEASEDKRQHCPADDNEILLGLAAHREIAITQARNKRFALQAALFKAMVASKDSKRFLPLSKLEQLITTTVVLQELATEFPTLSDSELAECASFVCDSKCSGSVEAKHLKFTPGRRLFALLIMIDQLDSFLHLRAAGLGDIDLPLEATSIEGHLKSTHTSRTFECFGTWSPFKLDAFNDWQWKLLAPYFSTTDDAQEKVQFYVLSPKTVMPWTEEGLTLNEGGQSGVKKVKIHESHHNFKFSQGSNPYFAVKKLHSKDKKQFDREVDALKRFSSRNNSNLIQLLATYHFQEDYCLLFPWADGNLRDFWMKHEPPTDDSLAFGRVMWMAEACYGLASGLLQIHNYQTTDEIKKSKWHLSAKAIAVKAKEASRSPSKLKENPSKRPRFGRHGDLKPENILWFNENKNGDYGILKISDFGLTKFHSRGSISETNARRTAGFSYTYRAPEIDLRSSINQHYDIWTLGCLYLEFVTWFLMGWSEIDRQSEERSKEEAKLGDDDWIPEDTFFKLEKVERFEKAVLKRCVIKVSQWVSYSLVCLYIGIRIVRSIYTILWILYNAKCWWWRKDIALAVSKSSEGLSNYCLTAVQSPKSVSKEFQDLEAPDTSQRSQSPLSLAISSGALGFDAQLLLQGHLDYVLLGYVLARVRVSPKMMPGL